MQAAKMQNGLMDKKRSAEELMSIGDGMNMLCLKA